jgi:hypothetical protein
MPKRLAAVLFAASLLALVLVPAASAGQHQVDSYCSPSGDYCTGVIRADGRIKLLVRTFSFLGPYILCVRPPGEPRECNSYPLAELKFGIHASRVDFVRHYSHFRHGRYAVSWHSEGFRIGPTLHFRH